jgi:Tfp pilus assembly protein PilZ
MAFGEDGLERRRADRVPMNGAEAPVAVVGAQLINASVYGMLIESPVAFEPEAVLPLRLVIRGDKADVVARVAACTPLAGARRAFGVGLEFVRIDETARGRLEEAVEDQSASLRERTGVGGRSGLTRRRAPVHRSEH